MFVKSPTIQEKFPRVGLRFIKINCCHSYETFSQIDEIYHTNNFAPTHMTNADKSWTLIVGRVNKFKIVHTTAQSDLCSESL